MVKDKTAGMGAHVKVATVGASKWVASQTSKTAKAAMEQAKGGLSVGEKFTLFAFEKISSLSRKGFTHVLMFLILIGYTALGALLFMAFEAPHEEAYKLSIHQERMELINKLWNHSREDYEIYVKDAKKLLLPFEDQLYKGFSVGVSSDTDIRVWTFWKAMFFCSTITTTIGYGHMTPKTLAGRALTIGYAIIGIPLFLILMADFGKLFTRALKAMFIFMRKCYLTAACVRARQHPTVVKLKSKTMTRVSSFPLCRSSQPSSLGTMESIVTSQTSRSDLGRISEEEISETEINDQDLGEHQFRPDLNKLAIYRELSVPDLNKIHKAQSRKLMEGHYSAKFLHSTKSIPELNFMQFTGRISSVATLSSSEELSLATTTDLSNYSIHSSADQQQPEEKNKSRLSVSRWRWRLQEFRDFIFCRWKEETSEEENEVEGGTQKSDDKKEMEDKYFTDGNFNLPISLALSILVLYMIIGCIIYTSGEPWSFFEAFYFIFISMTTIGFGDFVPEHPAFMMATALYLLFGLALTAMCINIIQEKLSDTFREASSKLKEQFSNIMAAAAAKENAEEEDFTTPTPKVEVTDVQTCSPTKNDAS